MRARWLWLVVALTGCVGAMDDPTHVHDLRVLGMQMNPPEVMIRGCNAGLFAGLISASGTGTGADGGIALPDALLALLAASAARPVEFTALIADPAGEGRSVRYRLLTCANVNDHQCQNEGDFLELKSGDTTAGELKQTLSLGALLLPDGTPLLLEAISQDTYKGLGGIRIPVVLELYAPDNGEHLYAQKLMVYTCPFFPSMKQNQQPVLPGMTLEGDEWAATDTRELQGEGPFKLEPDDFSALEEAYVVPSLGFKEVQLEESWKIAWYTTVGSMSPGTTGGTDIVTGTGRHNDEWHPDKTLKSPQDVDFTFVVRDGRGGESWLQRHAHWNP